VAHLSLSLLGPFQVKLHGEPATGFESSKVRALLAYLAIEASQPHLRSVLAGLLWPDRPDSAAFANLRNALANLRTAIGDRDATPPYLQITHETIQFNLASDHWLDVAAFRALADTTAADRRAHEQLEEAVALYRGDLLAGFTVRGSPEFENWALLVRERLQRQVLDALQRLAAHYESNGEAERGCEIAWRWVELAPWEERAHRCLMRLLARSGQRSAALAQYQACCQMLVTELGVEPGPETAALYERIRNRDLDPVALPPFLRVAPVHDHPTTVPFVARERELEQLDGYLAEALAGKGCVVFVTGEAGTGKTALTGEFGRRAQAAYAGLVVAGGNCNAYTGAGDPYLPFREILRQLTGDVESRWVAGTLSTEGARRLWCLIPLTVETLVERGPDLIDTLLTARPLVARAAMAAPGGAGWRDRLERSLAKNKVGRGQPDLRQVDLYAQVTALLTTLAREHPLLLTLDDLQWADAGTIDLLFHLGRRLAGSRILIAGIYRPSEVAVHRVDRRHPLAPVLRELQRQFGHNQIHLFQTGYRQFVESLLDSEPNRLGPDFREALYRHTQGHALCTVETLREMRERGDLVRDGAGRWIEGPAVDWASLPARCEGVIGERIERLPAVLREALEVASVEGETFTAEVVARVRGAGELAVVAQFSDQLDRRHRLVVSEGSQPVCPGGRRASRYRFRHIMFQEYIYSNLDKAERVYLHEAVGTALEQVHAGQTEPIAVQLARHYDIAGRMDKAANYAVQAGDRARGLYAHAEARQHYARALDALARLPDTLDTRRQRVDTLLAQTLSSWQSDPPARVLAYLTEAERLAQELPGPDGRPGGDRLRLAHIRLWLGRLYSVRGAYRDCVEHYERALSAARESGDTGLIALCSSAIGQALISQGYFGKANAMLAQAIPLLDQTGNWPEWLRALAYHGGSSTTIGDPAAGLPEIEYARALAEEKNARTEMGQKLLTLAYAYIQAGDPLRAITIARETVKAAEEVDDRLYVYIAYLWQSWAEARAGQHKAAATSATKSQAVMRELGEPITRTDYLAIVQAEIALGTGQMQEATALSERAVGIAQRMGSIFAEGLARRAWGQALAAVEHPRWKEAEAQLAHSLRLLEEGQCRLEAARTQVAWGIVCRDRGDLTGAQAHWERAAAQWETSGLEHELARTRTLLEDLESALRAMKE
jgi:DNA-binding SARP family transcriptional activator/tetratricopeptide (TPR) repeat protein